MLLKLLSKGLFWALHATNDEMTIPINESPCPETLFLCFSFSCPLDLQLAKDGLFAPSAAICGSTLGQSHIIAVKNVQIIPLPFSSEFLMKLFCIHMSFHNKVKKKRYFN